MVLDKSLFLYEITESADQIRRTEKTGNELPDLKNIARADRTSCGKTEK
jgi:hypothetical protein